jgi:hypothetical protein
LPWNDSKYQQVNYCQAKSTLHEKAPPQDAMIPRKSAIPVPPECYQKVASVWVQHVPRQVEFGLALGARLTEPGDEKRYQREDSSSGSNAPADSQSGRIRWADFAQRWGVARTSAPSG